MKADEQAKHLNRQYQTGGFWILVALVAVLAVVLFLPFLPAIMWAVVFSVLMYPAYLRLRKRRSASVSAGISVLATAGVIVLPLCMFFLVLYVQFSANLRDIDLGAPAGERVSTANVLGKIDETLQPLLSKVGSDFKVGPWFEENRKQITQTLSGPLTRFATHAGTTILSFVIALMTMFFLLRDGHRLREPALDLIPLPRADAEHLLERMANTIRAVFVGVVLVSVVQGVACGIAYALLGVPSAILWGLVSIVACMIPLLGAPAVYVPVSLYLLANGHWVQAVILLVVGFGLISNIDNFLRPFVIGSKTDLHYMAVFFSLLGGVLAFGAIGIMVGPLIMTTTLGIVDILRKRRQEALGQVAEATARS